MFELNYYNQSSIWNHQPEEYQIQLLADILSLIPQDTQSILDVGCGNGLITNALPDSIHIVGVDSSEEALKSVTKESYVGSITNLPFPDNSFDLVMATDVIEHLVDDIYFKSISELFRVASKYVLISVPHAEQLEKSFVKCASCGNVYHINHHQRSYREKELLDLCINEEWKVSEIRYSGDITRPPLDPIETSLLHQLQGYFIYDNCICSVCGSSEITKTESSTSKQVIGNLRSKHFYNSGVEKLANWHINRSEIIAFYQHSDVTNTSSLPKNDFVSVQKSSLVVNFNNPLQEVKSGFTEGCFWTKFFNHAKSQTFSAEDNSAQSLLIHFPVVPECGDKIIVQTNNIANLFHDIFLLTHDDLNNKTLVIDKFVHIGSGKLEFYVEYPWEVNSFGAAVTIKAPAGIEIQSAEYISRNQVDFQIDIIHLHQGHNIVSNSNLEYCRSWGLLVNKIAEYPQPSWLGEKNLNRLYDVIDSQISLSEYRKSLEVIIQKKDKEIANYSHLLEAKESQRSYVEKLLEVKESQRYYVEEEYKKVSKFATFFFKNAERKISRILVLSHMFPKPSQPNSGCFVAEQVKALRDYEGLDVRVISCQPFWCNTKNPIKIADLFSKYKEALYSSKWFSSDGIPTLFLPYLVGNPFLPFHLHGFTYRYAISSIADSIRQRFNFDLIHAHTAYLDGSAGLYLAEKYQIPFVITEHTGPFSLLTDKPIVRNLTEQSLSSANKIICVSSYLANDVKKHISSKDKSKIISLPNGVDTTKFYPEDMSSNGEKRDKLRLLSIISLDNNKNPFLLLQAFKLIREDGINVELKIVGGGELLEQLNQWVVNNSLTDFIHLLGWQPRNEIARILREKCDIMVLPSRSETFGVVVIEALASGKPVVSTRCGGPEGIITESYLGELCNNDDPVDLARAIKKVANNIEEYKADNIRSFAVNCYSYENLAKQINEVYQNI
ncbi:glycosyltransferase [Calothrix sp. 336/3]|uniref:glycosyltransferase n=1 Tax=Calothrix sp. 336/3 TaxID=1337936 RepID=UPI0004E2FAA4|nr:glycosyltransferase [Calothrix sp. 336/3]AKG22716.1 hypothetical protein IJ00_16820 [Calothrix sp. 336/3]